MAGFRGLSCRVGWRRWGGRAGELGAGGLRRGDPVSYLDRDGHAKCSAGTFRSFGGGWLATVECVSILGEQREKSEGVYFSGDPQNAIELAQFNSGNEATYAGNLYSAKRSGLLLDANSAAQNMLESEKCANLFDTPEFRANGWAPSQVLGKLMFAQGGLGSVGYGETRGNEDLIRPTLEGVPFGRTGACLNRRAAAWQTPNSGISLLERALTLLHELGHAYNLLFLRGSGASSIWQGDIIHPLQDYNNSLVYKECGVTYPSRRPGE